MRTLLTLADLLLPFGFWGESATSQRFVDAARPWQDDERYEVIKLLFGRGCETKSQIGTTSMSDQYNCPAM
jgi:hypothetical protein